MPATTTILDRNRANAVHSTGPRTPEGKAASAQNARTHGLTAAQLIIAPGEEPAFEALHQGLLQDFAPANTAEQVLFDALVHAAWNMRRIRFLEAELAASDPAALLDPELAPQFDRLGRYATRHARAYHRAQTELRKLQQERLNRSPQPAENTSVLPNAAQAMKQYLAHAFGRPVNPLEAMIVDQELRYGKTPQEIANEYAEANPAEPHLAPGLASFCTTTQMEPEA